MAIDDSIYFQNQSADIMGGVEKGLRMADLIGQRRQRQAEQQKSDAINQAYSSSLKMNPDGTMSIDENLAAQNIAKAGFGREALQFQQDSKARRMQEQSSALDLQKKQFEEISTSLQNIKDQNSFTRERNRLSGLGIDLTGVPEVYDANYINQLRERTGLAQRQKQQDFENRMAQQRLNLSREEIAARGREKTDAMNERKEVKQEKQNLAVTEIQDRYLNIKDSIKNLRQMVKDYGTQEVFGPENEQMDQYITAIATDTAKLYDPESVARESEVASFKKMLFEPTMWKREGTVQSILDNYEKMMDKRLETAYKVRGLENKSAVTNKTKIFDDEDQAAYEWAQKNSNDPRAKKILEIRNITNVGKNGI